jgi:hypothetical protein
MLAIAPHDLERFRAICERERCPFAVIGSATGDGRLSVVDTAFGNTPVDMDLAVLLGKPPRMTRRVSRERRELPPFETAGITLRDAAYRVLRLPAVADKTFLITIGDRTVGGLTARDQMVGPWQIPVADVAVALMGFDTYRGEAFAMGERTPLALGLSRGRRPDGGRRGDNQHRGGSHRGHRGHQALRELDGGSRPSRRGRCAVRYRPRGRHESLSPPRNQHTGRQG